MAVPMKTSLPYCDRLLIQYLYFYPFRCYLISPVCAVKMTHGKVIRCWPGLNLRIPGYLEAYG